MCYADLHYSISRHVIHVLEMAWNIWNYFLCLIEYKTFEIREVTAELLRTGQICYKLFGRNVFSRQLRRLLPVKRSISISNRNPRTVETILSPILDR